MVRVGAGGDDYSTGTSGGDTGTDGDGGSSTTGGGSIPGAPDPAPDPEPAPEPSGGGGVVDRVTSTVGATVSDVSAVADDVGGTVTDTIDDVQGGVNRVEETLPGPTGAAFATGVGVAAVPEPTPITETTGAAIAGGAALAGGAVLASRAIRDRGSELEIGDRVTSELGIGQQSQDVSELEVGERTTSEVGVGDAGPTETEVGLGSTTTVDEIQIDDGDGFGVSAGTAVGSGAGTGTGLGEDIGPTIDAPDEPSIDQTGEDTATGGDTGTIDRDPVRFPANEGATGTAPDVVDQQVPDFDPTDAFGLGTAVGGGALVNEGAFGLDTSRETNTATGGGDVSIAEPPADDTIGGGTTAGPGTETGATEQPTQAQELLTATTTTPAAQAPAEPFGSPGAQSFATPEVSAFENQVVEPTTTGPTGQGEGRRRRPRRLDRGDDDEDGTPGLLFAQDSDEFGSGLLSGDEALDRFLGR